MTPETTITLSAAAVTLVGTGITIWQAWQVRTYRQQIKIDVRKINLSGVVEALKRAQDDIRRLPTAIGNVQRGVKPVELIHSVRGHFDLALGVLDAKGPEGDIRALLTTAQENVNTYEATWVAGAPNAQNVHDLQAYVQDAVSQANSRIFRLEGKA